MYDGNFPPISDATVTAYWMLLPCVYMKFTIGKENVRTPFGSSSCDACKLPGCRGGGAQGF